MVSALDVAKYIIGLSLSTGEPVTNMKLQKLLYYAYSWYLVEKEGKETLFNEEIEAWQYGPVIRSVYNIYNKFKADIIKESLGGDDSVLNEEQKSLVRETFLAYGDKTAIQLMRLTHSETPWVKSFEQGDFSKIPKDLIYNFYLEKKNISQKSKVDA